MVAKLASKSFVTAFMNDIDQLDPNRPKNSLLTVLLYIIAGQYAARFLVLGYLVNQGKGIESYLKYDKILAAMSRNGLNQYAVYLAAFFFALFLILAHYRLYFTMDYSIWSVFHQMIDTKAFMGTETSINEAIGMPMFTCTCMCT